MSEEKPETGSSGPDNPVEGIEKPFRPDGVGPEAPLDRTPNRHAVPEGTPAPPAGTPGSPFATPPPKRNSAQIRADIDAQRAELGKSVDQLRDRVTELTDWKSQLRKHRKQIIVGAVATGFVVGGLMALRRR
ncbi:MAG: DUF3618 domain-containing protein [Solirubrobacterales bacterium]|nr:DUF3618 domain-containing protein [Solirubrobacterales bacterium]MCB8915947.1 DUF3618 domain-containing protein [Thermoleophilales bacterium]